MSVENVILFNRKNIVSPQRWSNRIKELGYLLSIDADFDMEQFVGYLPCKYSDKDSGFEYEFDEIDEEDFYQDELSRIGDRKHMVILTTHSDYYEALSSSIAAAVLAELCDGFVLEGGEDMYAGKEAIIRLPMIQEEFLRLASEN